MPAARWVLSAAVKGAGLLLFIDGGQLSNLELYPVEQDGVFGEFPPVSGMSF
ncbi:hypothetical protein [Corynebacterium sp. A21]|uniref:hypothetical protein n=1 Tax=Corynebacterium sp. A21 TaxID=3457318 RepID=UPI003FD6859A